jgi:hypothetical protein
MPFLLDSGHRRKLCVLTGASETDEAGALSIDATGQAHHPSARSWLRARASGRAFAAHPAPSCALSSFALSR